MQTYSMLALGVVAALLLALLSIVTLRRRTRAGQATEFERRFDAALRRFDVELDAFKFAPQSAVKILLNHDHVISAAIEDRARETGLSREELRLKVHRYLEEIVPFFKPLMYYSFGYYIAHYLLNFAYRIDYSQEELDRIKKACAEKNGSVIYVINHRSNFDFVLLPYVLKDNVALSFAVGEWARVWPLDYIFKSFGSYFLRRGYREPLYHTVLRRYVQVVTKNGVTQAMFPEGALSRDGYLRSPKIGLLDSILCSKEDRSFKRDILFVPVAINYDRVLEDRVLVGEVTGGAPADDKAGMAQRVFRILFGNLGKFYRREIRKNGIASVRFGEPVLFEDWHAEREVDIFSLPKYERRVQISNFVDVLFERIGSLVAATPLCVVARVLVDETAIDRSALHGKVEAELARLKEAGVFIVEEDRGANWMIDGALMRFSLRRLVTVGSDRVVTVTESERPIIAYYANSIAHHIEGEVPKVEIPKYAKT